jgi:hypothetical protein
MYPPELTTANEAAASRRQDSRALETTEAVDQCYK